VRDITTNKSDKAIVKTIISMARGLNIEVIAEGVETEEQRQLLIADGCIAFQGYLFSKPLAIEEFEALIQRGVCK
jgi:EAL domain-containing protein (putative c-di-GMP-specific phosphodiesterase class I)